MVEGKSRAENYVLKAIGIEMDELIKKVEEKFKGEYGFSPSIIDITNLIARRALEGNLF